VRNGRSQSRTGVYAAITAVAITAGLGAVGVAGADESAAERTLTGEVNSGPWSPSNDITIQTGDSVTWTFTPGSFHNVQSTGTNWPEPIPDDDPVPDHPDVTRTFSATGVYTFVCDAHPGSMDGSITVQDAPVTPTPTVSPTASPTATATAPPTGTPPPPPGGGSTHVHTPAPSGISDTVDPRLSSLRLKALRRAVRVRFTLSEPATVTIRVKRRGARKVLKSARVQARAGTRTVTLRSKRLRKGRYTVQIQARDAVGNRSSLATKRLRLRR
jgi:plastocyanin